MNIRAWFRAPAQTWCRRAALICWLIASWLASRFALEVASGRFTDGLTLIESALALFVGLALRCRPGASSVATAMTLQSALLVDRLRCSDVLGCGLIVFALLSAIVALARVLRGDAIARATTGPCPSLQPAPPSRCERNTRTLPAPLAPLAPSRRTLSLPLGHQPTLGVSDPLDGPTIADPRALEDPDTWVDARRRPPRPRRSRYRACLTAQRALAAPLAAVDSDA